MGIDRDWLSDGIEIGLLLWDHDLLLGLDHSVSVSDAFGLAELEDDDCEAGGTDYHAHLEDLVVPLPLHPALFSLLVGQIAAVYFILMVKSVP